MIHLHRNDLKELAEFFILANTPASLYHTLRETNAVRRMVGELPAHSLSDYYDAITSRARRTEIVMGLAYAVLVACLAADHAVSVDPSRLEWGELMAEISDMGKHSSQTLTIHASPPPRISEEQSADKASRRIAPHRSPKQGGMNP